MVQWSREEDIQHDMFRPLYHDTLAAALDVDGKPLVWTHRVTASAVVARFFPTWFKDGVDPDAVDGARELPYELPALHVDFVRCEPARVPTGFWRGVGPTHNGFVVVYRGEVTLGDTVVPRARMAVLANTQGSDGVVLRAGAEGARAILVAGRPLKEPIAQYGPFVMNTQQEIFQAVQDFQAGKLA